MYLNTDMGSVGMDGDEGEVDIRLDDFGSIEMTEDGVEGEIEGLAEFEINDNKLVVKMKSAAKLIASASAALAIMALQ